MQNSGLFFSELIHIYLPFLITNRFNVFTATQTGWQAISEVFPIKPKFRPTPKYMALMKGMSLNSISFISQSLKHRMTVFVIKCITTNKLKILGCVASKGHGILTWFSCPLEIWLNEITWWQAATDDSNNGYNKRGRQWGRKRRRAKRRRRRRKSN